MQIEIARADRPWKLPVDKLLIGGNGIEGNIEPDDGPRPSFRRRTQRKVGTARQLPAGRSVTRRLRKARVRTHPHDRVGPMGPRDYVDGGTNHSLGIGIVGRGHRKREFIAGNAPAKHTRGQRLPHAPGDGNDEFIAAQNAVRCGDIIHAVQLDQRKGRALIVGALCERKIQELQRF